MTNSLLVGIWRGAAARGAAARGGAVGRPGAARRCARYGGWQGLEHGPRALEATREIAVLRQTRELFGDRIQVSDASFFDDQACADRFSCTPYRAGIQIYRTGGVCTGAFQGKKNGVNAYYMMTAGHCGALNVAWFHDQAQIGLVKFRAYANGGTADAELISRAGLTGHKNWVFVTGGEPARTVTARQGHDADTAGNGVCQSGQTTGFWCGVIIDTDVDNVDDGTIIQNNVREASYASDFGDSGGPVFYGHLAMGVHKGGFPNGHAGYSHIWEVENRLGVTVLTAPV